MGSYHLMVATHSLYFTQSPIFLLIWLTTFTTANLHLDYLNSLFPPDRHTKISMPAIYYLWHKATNPVQAG